MSNNVYPQVEVQSLYGATQTQTGRVFNRPATEAFTHDADGNLTQDGRWTYVWDGENRLIEMKRDTDTPAGARQRLVFEYDHQGRRIRKQFYTHNGSSWVLSSDTAFAYDGWNLVGELNAASSNARLRTYLWGLDLSGSEQGAGGVGGLWLVIDYTSDTTYHWPAYDGNGNVAALVAQANGSLSARYEYGPFGEAIRATGPMARKNPFRFSTKYTDNETGLIYYGYRYYNPSTGRWMSRDPIGQKGGMNLHAFLKNAPLSSTDYLGLIGYFDWYINMIEKALAAGETEQAAAYARVMYEDIYRGSYLDPKGKPLARDLLGRWLGFVDAKGTPRILSREEIEGILRNDTAKEWIGMKMRQKGITASGFHRAIDLDGVYGGPPGSDAYLALGEFKLRFTGYVDVKKTNVSVMGRWTLLDRYDWQDPGNKFVELGRSVIYDRYAELLEDADPPLAFPFFVLGSTDVCFRDTYDLNATPVPPKGRGK
jgi:RHS repeat-associated protein